MGGDGVDLIESESASELDIQRRVVQGEKPANIDTIRIGPRNEVNQPDTGAGLQGKIPLKGQGPEIPSYGNSTLDRSGGQPPAIFNEGVGIGQIADRAGAAESGA